MDGFDSYDNATDLEMAYYSVNNYSSNNIGLGTTSGRFGQGAVIFSGYANTLIKSFSTGLTEVWMGCAFNPATGTNIPYNFFTMLSILNAEVILTYNPVNGEWAAWFGPYTSNSGGGAVLAHKIVSGNYSIGTGAWHYIEFHYKIGNNSNGILELWIDGIQIFNNTSANTSYTGNTVFYSVMVGGTIGSSSILGTFDDWYILDPNSGSNNITRLGDSRIETLVPISDAGPNQGTPSNVSVGTGQHYTMVNEATNNNGATYLAMPTTSGSEEVFGLSSLSSIPLNIWGVRVLNIVEKTDGGFTQGNAVIVSGGVTEYGPNQTILSTYFGQYGIFETDPNTGSEWTYESVNAADAGFAVV